MYLPPQYINQHMLVDIIEAAKFEADCKAGKVKKKQQEIEEKRKEEELRRLDEE